MTIDFTTIPGAMRAARARRRAYRQMVDELGSLSDRDLADFGIRRFDIPAVARREVRGL